MLKHAQGQEPYDALGQAVVSITSRDLVLENVEFVHGDGQRFVLEKGFPKHKRRGLAI